MNAAKKVAAAVQSVDFLGWQGERYVVARRDNSSDVAHPTSHSHHHSSTHPPSNTHLTRSHGRSGSIQGSIGRRSQASADTDIELKELPPRRRLDTGFGVDLGGLDGCWLERIDVPIDYELVGGDDT
jgi:hypothetical protein